MHRAPCRRRDRHRSDHAQQPVVIDAQDTEESLHERIKEIERVLLVDVLTRAVHEGISVRGRSVTFGE